MHAAVGTHLHDNIKKADTSECWLCDSGEPQSRHHLFTRCRAWAPQIRRLWKDIRKACGWKHPRAPSVRWLWDARVTEAVLKFLRETRVGCIVAIPRGEDGGGSEMGGDESRPGLP